MADKKLEYYVVDVETTGFSPKWHEVTEVSFIRCRDRNELTRAVKIHYPNRVSPKALEVTNRTMNDRKFGEPKAHVVSLVEKFFEQDGKEAKHRCMIAHNHSFDKRFLNRMWSDVGKVFPVENWFETKKLAKAWALSKGTPWPSYKLQDVLSYTGLRASAGAHDARSDARNTYLLWKTGVEMGLDHLSCIKRYEIEK